jgi:hypothetical protein
MCHVVFMSHACEHGYGSSGWRVWKDSHTQIAIDTQSTFGYRQNLIVRRLSRGRAALPCDGRGEFPPEAMTSDHAFYATGGDDELLKANERDDGELRAFHRLYAKIDVIPMSEYLVKPLVRP